ncbi:MAG TPA: hypothetical protein VIJ38_05690 [Acidobacteriaceae bacterium]
MHTKGPDKGLPGEITPREQDHRDSEHPGYETQDVSVGGVTTFLAGLAGSVIIFFFFCFAMGKAINYALIQHDGPEDKWHTSVTLGATSHGEKREDLTSSATMEQRQLQQMTQVFPTPRLEMDDGNQDISDLHAREDLLLSYYSSSPDLPAGTVRIPIERAMQLIVERGLPKAPATPGSTTLMAGESVPTVTAPLTDGFARTGYELQTIETREENNEFNRAEAKQ